MEGNPVFGIMQPINGMPVVLLSVGMPKLSKGPPPDELVGVREALSTNLRAYIRVKYGAIPETSAAERVGKATGVGKNTVLRALGKGPTDADIRLDTLVRLAMHFGVAAQDLIHDHSKLAARALRHSDGSKKKNNETARDQRISSDVDRASLQRRRGA